MDPLSLSVAALLAKALGGAAEEAGQGAADALGRLVAAVRRRFAGDEGAQSALTAVECAPADEASTRTLAEAIERASADGDGKFRAELEKLVGEAERDPRVGQFITEVRENAQVGKIVNIGSARDVSF
jgi:hypothetical protein